MCLNIASLIYYAIIYECEYLDPMWAAVDRMWTTDHRCEYEPAYTAYDYEPVYDRQPTSGFFRFIIASYDYCISFKIYVIRYFFIIKVFL